MMVIIDLLKDFSVAFIEIARALINHVHNLYHTLTKKYFTENLEYSKNVPYTMDGTPHYQYGIDFITLSHLKSTLEKTLYKLWNKFMDLRVLLTDIYAIRRIVDKPYCTNAIVYVGDAHAWNMLCLLTNYFDFSITHASYSAQQVGILNAEIKDRTIAIRTWYAKNLNPPVFYQCSV